MIDLHVQKTIQTTEGKQLLDIALQIPTFGFVTLFGKSGVGKTTLLRMLAGLVTPESGHIAVADEVWFDSSKKINVKPQQRNIGFVFQEYALFPNMTVVEQLLFAQQTKDLQAIEELIELFHLSGLRNRKPGTLSGGQKQRLAVARALARKPLILLLDEPLSALDEETRQILQEEIIQAHKKIAATTILVSHDKAEIIKLSDQVYKIDKGQIVASGSADEMFSDSNNVSFSAQVVEIIGTDIFVLLNSEKIKLPQSYYNQNQIKVGDTLQVSFDAIKVSLKS